MEDVGDLRLISLLDFLQKSPTQMNILNQIFKSLRPQEVVILSSSVYENTYVHGSLKGVLKAVQVFNL